MEVADDHRPADGDGARHFGIGPREVCGMAEHETAPDHVERVVGDGQRAGVALEDAHAWAADTSGGACRDHFAARLHAGCGRRSGDQHPPPCSATDVEQPAPGEWRSQAGDQTILKQGDSRFPVVGRRPEGIALRSVQDWHIGSLDHTPSPRRRVCSSRLLRGSCEDEVRAPDEEYRGRLNRPVPGGNQVGRPDIPAAQKGSAMSLLRPIAIAIIASMLAAPAYAEPANPAAKLSLTPRGEPVRTPSKPREADRLTGT